MTSSKLSLVATSYVRKLIYRYRSQLGSVLVKETNRSGLFKAMLEPDADLNYILAELYLEPIELARQIQFLDSLVGKCQDLERKGQRGMTLKAELDEEILGLFSLKVMKNIEPLFDGMVTDINSKLSSFATTGRSQDRWGWSQYLAS